MIHLADVYCITMVDNLGLKEYEFYTVFFAVSRALGILSNGIWAEPMVNKFKDLIV